MEVNYCENHNIDAIDSVENAIGELAQNPPPHVSVYNLVLDRITNNLSQGSIDLG